MAKKTWAGASSAYREKNKEDLSHAIKRRDMMAKAGMDTSAVQAKINEAYSQPVNVAEMVSKSRAEANAKYDAAMASIAGTAQHTAAKKTELNKKAGKVLAKVSESISDIMAGMEEEEE